MHGVTAPGPRVVLVLMVCVLATRTASALKCYDCLSTALPSCVDDNKGNEFPPLTCDEEKFCSTLTLKDDGGHTIVTRQCASSTEAENLRVLLEGTLHTRLNVESFATCQEDLCNAKVVSAASPTSTSPAAAALAAALPLLVTLFAPRLR